jgi:8-oxo-dGTP diphosphatase
MKTLVVAAAVVERDGRFLVTRRQKGVHLEGFWEFPGGKCEPGEMIVACLRREIREELDTEIVVDEEIFSTTHTYPDRRVKLHFMRCRLVGEPTLQVGQELRWASRHELGVLEFPPADAELIRLLTQV